MNQKKRSPFREISFSILVGFLTAFLLYVNVGQTAELGCLRLRYLLAQLFSTDVLPELTVVETYSSKDLLDEGPYDSLVADCIDRVAGSDPAAIVFYKDLRQVKPNSRLMDSIRRHQNKIIVSYFGIDEKTPNVYGELAKAGIKCGYTELPVSPYGVVCKIPTKTKNGQGELLTAYPIQPLSTAVFDVAFPEQKQQWMQIAETYPVGTEFWIDFLSKAQIKTIPMAELNSGNAKTFSDSISQKIVIFASQEETNVQTPLPGLMTPLSIHVQAIGTFLKGVHLADFSVIAAWLILPLGALIGALYHMLKPLQRVNAILLSFLAIIIFGQISFQLLNLVIPTMAPLMVILSCYLVCSVIFLEVEQIDKARDVAMSLEARTEEERKRISQEIHDDTLPSLARIKRIAHSMKTGIPEDDTPDQICEWLDLTITDMRRLVDDLHPLALENLGLSPAIESLVSRFEKHSKIEATFNGSSDKADAMPASAKLSIYRIVQECLNNVEKHAEASQVKVSMVDADGWLNISVADNGKGFSIETVNGDSHGITNIQERAKLIHATVIWKNPEIFSSGTELVVRIEL